MRKFITGCLLGLVIGLALSTSAQHNATTGRSHSKVSTVTFSATPTFDGAATTVFKITLTGNVTSSTFSNGVAGNIYVLIVCQDSTGLRTFVYPTNWKGGVVIGSTLSTCTTQVGVYDGANVLSTSLGLTGL